MIAQTSRLALDDPAGETLARSKFAADFAHDPIPSESVIRAAKEKRAKLRAAASTSASSSDDFISLAPFSKPSSALKRYDAMEVDTGPHPHSRLQREEDEIGDGEEEFASSPVLPNAYRSANGRRRSGTMHRGGRWRRLYGVTLIRTVGWRMRWMRTRRSRERAQTAADADADWVCFSGCFERGIAVPAAPIPASAPLPSVSSCSTRLQLTLRALEQSTAASAAVIESSMKELETLEAAEGENKLDVAAVEDKASWFNELDEFVVSLARFMEEKMERV